MNTPSSNVVSPSLAASSPHLLKELTSGNTSTTSSIKASSDNSRMTVSNNTEATPAASATAEVSAQPSGHPPCKKLKLDIEVANNIGSSKATTMRQRLLEKRLARRARQIESYKDNMSELFFLQSKGNVVDLPTFRKRPSQQYLNFLKSNNAPDDIMDEVRLAVLGPNAVFEKAPISVSSASGKVTVTSAAMAAAVVAAHGSNWKSVTSEATSSSSTSAAVTTSTVPSKPPYSPRSNLLSPVKYGDQLQPRSLPATASASGGGTTAVSAYASYRLPSYSRDLLAEKVRQEAWVTRRINDLSREGLWSEKRLPKICERPRQRTHWDAVLAEVQWLAVDFHEERKWKVAAAKMLAYSAKVYVEQLADHRARKAAALEKSHRKIAKFMATQVELFWSSISIIHSDKSRIKRPTPSSLSSNNKGHPRNSNSNTISVSGVVVNELFNHGEASSESGVCNLEDDSEDSDNDADVFDHEDFQNLVDLDLPDDESTIEEQELYEAKVAAGSNSDVTTSTSNFENAEITILEADNAKPLEEVLACAFPDYDLSNSKSNILNPNTLQLNLNAEAQHDSSISSDEDDDDGEVDSDDEDDEDDIDFTENSNELNASEDYYDFSDSESIINLPLSSRQRKLYDDYLSSASSRKALESLDAERIAEVLHTLRKICNHPQLLVEASEEVIQNQNNKNNKQHQRQQQQLFNSFANVLVPEDEELQNIASFPRVADDLQLPKLVASKYDPLHEIDLASLNLVFFTHESTLTAITSDRLRKCCASRSLIEELPMSMTTSSSSSSAASSNALHQHSVPKIPVYPFRWTNDGGQMENNVLRGRNSIKQEELQTGNSKQTSNHHQQQAFHKDSLNVIAKFNERRCHGMPLYGQDLIEVLTIVSPEAICSPPKMSSPEKKVWKGSHGLITTNYDNDQGSYSSRKLLPDRLATPFWPLFGAKKAKSSKHLRSRYLRSTVTSRDLASASITNLKIHSDLQQGLCLPPKVQLVAGVHRNPLISNHFAVVEAVKYARAKARQNEGGLQNRGYGGGFGSSLNSRFLTSSLKKDFRHVSSKLEQLDELLQKFRKNGERALIFCEMPEMLSLLQRYLHSHHYAFAYLDPDAEIKDRFNVVQDFSHRSHFSVLLTSPRVAAASASNQNKRVRFNGLTNICNVVFFDSNLNNTSDKDNHLDTLEWCRSFNGLTQLNIHKLVCEDTVEDSLSVKALQQKLMLNNENSVKMETNMMSQNGPVCKIKKHALEALLSPKLGDNGVMSGSGGGNNKARKTTMEDILEDPEAIAQLYLLWTNKISNNSESGRNLVELSQQIDKGCVKEERKPIYRYAQEILPTLMKDQHSNEDIHKIIDIEDIETAKLEWEEAFQKELAILASELEDLERMEPPLTYSREDASRSWHSGLDGQPMALWTPPMPVSTLTSEAAVKAGNLRVDEHLSYLYQMSLMEEASLPPVYVKKELLKRTALEAELDGKHKMHHRNKDHGHVGNLDGYPSSSSTYAPRSLFDRCPSIQKQKFKAQQKRMPMGAGGGYVHPLAGGGPGGAGGQQAGATSGNNINNVPGGAAAAAANPSAVAGLRYPMPRQQIEAENQPEWLIQEDWALLNTIKEIQGLPLTLNTMSPAHTVNWDLVSDMVNAVSRVYRGPRQCKYRFDNIIAPREEGRILYDMPGGTTAASMAASVAAAASNKKSKKKQMGGNGGSASGDRGGGTHGGSSGGMKLHSGGPAKMNRPMKTSQIFNQDKNTSWSALFATRFETIKAVANKRSPTTKPLVVNPQQKSTKHAGVLGDYGISYETPLNPIQVAANRAERIQKEKQKNAQDQAAQLNQQRVAAAQAAANAAQQSAAATARVAIVQQQQQQQNQQQQQAVVVGIPNVTAGSGTTQQVRQVITHQSVQELVRSQQQQQQSQTVSIAQQQQQTPTVVVTSQPPVVSVGNLTASQIAQTLVKQQQQQQQQAQVSKAAGGVITTATTSALQSRLTPQQINILKQQALIKKNQNIDKARLAGITGQAGIGGTSTAIVAATTNTGQKVSIAVTPSGGVTLASIASNSMPITVVTQAVGGQQKTRLIQGVTAAGGNKLRMTENEMKLLLARQQQQQQQQAQNPQNQQQKTAQQNAVTQILGMTQGGQQVATLVKPATSGGNAVTVSGGAGGATQSVTIPVQMQNVQGIKTLRQPGGAQQTMVQLRHQQLVQQTGGPRSKIIPQGNTILAQTSQGQKVALSQVGGKGLPAQLIVSSGNTQKPVTVQQIQQIKAASGQAGQGGATGVQHLIPHAMLQAKGQGQGSTVQARVIPATVAGRPQQIHVVAAPASSAQAQANLAGRQAAAPNVTVDASGRPTSGTNNVQLGSQIRVAGASNQLLNQVLSVRTAAGNVISQAPTSTTTTTTTKLHVVHPSQQQQQDHTQQNG